MLCTLHPYSRKVSKIASEFGLSPRVACAVVEVVIRAPCSRRRRTIDTWPYITAESSAELRAIGVGGEWVEVQV